MFITAASIRRLIRELAPPLISAWDPRLTDEQWREEFPCAESQEAIVKVQESFFDSERYIEGSKFDLTLDHIEVSVQEDNLADLVFGSPKASDFSVNGKRRNRPTVEAPCENDVYFLIPHKAYHIVTREFVNMPGWLMGLPHAKMGVLQSNVGFFCSLVPPGYSGTLMALLHPLDFYTIKKGEPICSIAFELFASDYDVRLNQITALKSELWRETVTKETDPYKGRRGGKVHGTQGEIWSAS